MKWKYSSLSSKIFDIFNYLFIGLLTLSCILPIWHILVVSFSDKAASSANLVKLWPIGFHTMAYQRVFQNAGFLHSFLVSVERVIVGTAINIFLICITAYPLSRESEELKGRNVLMWILIIPMLLSGGLIPTYLVIRDTGLLNSFWSLIIPGAVPIFSVIMMMNFFRALPKSLYEAAMIDGANHLTILLKIFIPISMASIATLSLFSMVGHWNDWFSGIIYLNDVKNWPLQSFLRQMLVPSFTMEQLNFTDVESLKLLSDRNFRAAQLFISIIPIMCVYPFLQKYFVVGIVLGSVKE